LVFLVLCVVLTPEQQPGSAGNRLSGHEIIQSDASGLAAFFVCGEMLAGSFGFVGHAKTSTSLMPTIDARAALDFQPTNFVRSKLSNAPACNCCKLFRTYLVGRQFNLRAGHPRHHFET